MFINKDLFKTASLGYVILLTLFFFQEVYCVGQIIFAVNAGGEAHTDTNGIKYESDTLANKIGIASDYGKRLLIGRVPPNDHILYQTERYHTNTFGYDLPIPADGDYVLVLKFCEVYFEAPDQKVFDVVLNGEHTIVSDLDIFSKVDKGVAHDEYIPFQVNNGCFNKHSLNYTGPWQSKCLSKYAGEAGKLIVNGEESDIQGKKIRVEFIKGYKDNPKINAFYLMKGTLEDVPKLPPLTHSEARHQEPLPKLDIEETDEDERSQKRPRTVPKMPEIDEPEESSIMLPVFIAIGAFIPILFLLCKL